MFLAHQHTVSVNVKNTLRRVFGDNQTALRDPPPQATATEVGRGVDDLIKKAIGRAENSLTS
jgi:hypothetical protein